MENFEQRLLEIEERNRRVERDKGWETSLMRRGFIAGITYFVVLLVLWIIGAGQPFLGAIIPVLGYLLSTLSLPLLKQRWLLAQQRGEPKERL